MIILCVGIAYAAVGLLCAWGLDGGIMGAPLLVWLLCWPVLVVLGAIGDIR